jgi:hypothetical protein
MKAENDIPRDKFALAHEAIRNLLFPELDGILRGGWSAALAANSEINIRPISQRTGSFNRHFLPLLKDLASLLAGAYRRYFKLALAQPQQTKSDPHEWALHQLDPAVGVTLEWIRDWYILACDGSNQYVQPVGSVPFQPGQTASISIPLNEPETVSPKSWRAPSWLFAVGPVVGIGPLKTKHVPATDSEERLSAAHTRLLLKGARRVFLWKLGAEIETVRNEEIAAAGAIPPATIFVEQVKGPIESKDSKHQPIGTEGLGKKVSDLSKYMDGLTEKQQLALSLRLEYRLSLTEVASRMRVNRKTAYEHFMAARRNIDQIVSNDKRAKNRTED